MLARWTPTVCVLVPGHLRDKAHAIEADQAALGSEPQIAVRVAADCAQGRRLAFLGFPAPQVELVQFNRRYTQINADDRTADRLFGVERSRSLDGDFRVLHPDAVRGLMICVPFSCVHLRFREMGHELAAVLIDLELVHLLLGEGLSAWRR